MCTLAICLKASKHFILPSLFNAHCTTWLLLLMKWLVVWGCWEFFKSNSSGRVWLAPVFFLNNLRNFGKQTAWYKNIYKTRKKPHQIRPCKETPMSTYCCKLTADFTYLVHRLKHLTNLQCPHDCSIYML